MSTTVGLKEVEKRWEAPLATPLDEAVWKAWAAKGRAEERRGNEVRVASVRWISIATLVATAGLWSQVGPYGMELRFVVFAGAIVVTSQAFRLRHFAFAAVFGALALLYNPVAPVFNLSGEWQRALVVASAVPFVASIGWRNMMEVSHA